MLVKTNCLNFDSSGNYTNRQYSFQIWKLRQIFEKKQKNIFKKFRNKKEKNSIGQKLLNYFENQIFIRIIRNSLAFVDGVSTSSRALDR